MGIGQVGLILGVVALVLGGASLGISLTHAGPAGATGGTGATGPTGGTGATGPTGPAGPGAEINESYVTSGTYWVNNTTCAAEPGADVGFKVSQPGTVVLTVTTTIVVNDVSGGGAVIEITLNTNPTGCGSEPQLLDIDSQPDGIYYTSVSLVQTSPVSTAGTYTYYLVCEEYGGTAPSYYDSTQLVGVFYPSS